MSPEISTMSREELFLRLNEIVGGLEKLHRQQYPSFHRMRSGRPAERLEGLLEYGKRADRIQELNSELRKIAAALGRAAA